MMNETTANSVGIIGAGAMGSGIAQVAASHGWTVYLMDVDDQISRRAIDGVKARFDRLVEKDRMTKGDRDAAARRLLIADAPSDFEDCELLIEAVIEDLRTKSIVLLDLLPALRDDCILATNTSSLSVTKLGRAIAHPRRTLGMHFFNPAPLMKLVEVIAGAETERGVVDRVTQIAESWGKKVARAADVPGFIVNHVARPYYLEAFRILEDGYALPDEIDRTMKELGGFRMGPLELTDLIGQDVNTATTRSVWEQLDRPPLLTPSRLQEQLVADGHLGRKTGRGVFDYSGDEPTAALKVEEREWINSDALRETASEFTAAAQKSAPDPSIPGTQSAFEFIFARILIAVIVQAHVAFERGVAEKADIDTALKFGVNYPKGPFEWTRQIGTDVCTRWLTALNATVDDDRFAVPASMKAARAATG